MAKFEKVENTHGLYQFYCAGCKCHHYVWTDARDGVSPWGFNGDVNSPTITPSILVRYPVKDFMNICHSFITNGRIQYLSDCTHELACQTVELPEID